MKTVRAIARASSLLLTMAFVAGCGKWTTIREGNWNGSRYTIEERSTAGPFAFTNSLDWRIRVGDLPAVPVNANSTDWGPPYSADLYGANAYFAGDPKQSGEHSLWQRGIYSHSFPLFARVLSTTG